MKLIVQIPCLNEIDNLREVVENIPRNIKGIDKVEVLVIDDGSTDGTANFAKELGVEHILIHRKNRGLAKSFSYGLEEALKQGADIVVNTDGDHQYPGHEIAKIVQPIIAGEADIVIGNRGGMDNPNFSKFKRRLQVLGSLIISSIVGLEVPDAVSGFRAISKEAGKRIQILTSFSYTIEMLVQASFKDLTVKSVLIETNPKVRESRLFKSIPYFIKMSVMTLLRVYTMYKPLRVFSLLGGISITVGLFPILRFIYFYFSDGGQGHTQSLVIGGTLMTIGVILMGLGIIADLISFNRKVTERLLRKVQALEERLDQNK